MLCAHGSYIFAHIILPSYSSEHFTGAGGDYRENVGYRENINHRKRVMELRIGIVDFPS